VALIEMIFATAVTLAWGITWLVSRACYAAGWFFVAAPGWALSFAVGFLLYAMGNFFFPAVAAVNAVIGLAMIGSAGVSIRVAAQIAHNNAPVFRQAFAELTHQAPSLLERELNRPHREPVTIDAKTGRVTHA
jgi:hypothetical protein